MSSSARSSGSRPPAPTGRLRTKPSCVGLSERQAYSAIPAVAVRGDQRWPVSLNNRRLLVLKEEDSPGNFPVRAQCKVQASTPVECLSDTSER